MKKLMLIAAVVLVFCLVMVAAGEATPVYYTFEGVMNEDDWDLGLINDGAGIITEHGIVPGTVIQYKFLLDFDKPGAITHADGTMTEIPETESSVSYYMEYISGGISEYSTVETVESVNEYNEDKVDRIFSSFRLGASGATQLNSLDWDVFLTSPSVGVGFGWFKIQERVWDEKGNISSLYGFYKITDITPVETPVPEPSTIILLGAGVAGLMGFRRRKKGIEK